MLLTCLSIYAPLIVSFCTTYFCVPLCQRIAYRFSILDMPNDTVKAHKIAVPYLGGVAIILGFFCSAIFFSPSCKELLPFLCGLFIFFLVGLIDDIYSLNPLHKTIGQCLASCWFIIESIYLKKMFFTHHPWFIPLILFWVILITNAFNLIDVLDGLASCVALHSCAGFLIIALIFNQMHVLSLLLGLLGSLMAFLLYNKPPASIYMGDAGSLFLGGFFGILPFFITWNIQNNLGFLAAFLILAIPIVEVGMLIVIRTYHNVAFYKASPHHFCHYLLRYNYSKETILLMVSILCWLYIFIALGWSLNYLSFLSLIISTLSLFIIWTCIILQPLNLIEKNQ